MSLKNISPIFALIVFLLTSPVKSFSNESYTVTFQNDSSQEVYVEIPIDWILIEDTEDAICDFKLMKKNSDTECQLFIIKTDLFPITQDDLLDYVKAAKKICFINKQIENSQFSLQPTLCLHTFNLPEENIKTNVCMCFYSDENFIFGILVTNKTDPQALLKDIPSFISNIFLINRRK